MRRLRLLVALALGLTRAAAFATPTQATPAEVDDSHLPKPNLEFNITLPLTSLVYPRENWAANYEESATTDEEKTSMLQSGKELIGLVPLPGKEEHPSFSFPGQVRAAYVYGRPNGVSKAKFTFAGKEYDGTPELLLEQGLIAMIEDVPWFERTADGQFATLGLRLEGSNGGAVVPNPKPVIIESVVIRTGMQAQTDVFDHVNQTVLPTLESKWDLSQSEHLNFVNGTSDASAKDWSNSVDYGIHFRSDTTMASLNTFAVGPYGSRLEIAVPANTSWVGVNATRGPLLGNMLVQQYGDSSGQTEVTIPLQEHEYSVNKLVWFASLDPEQTYNITLSGTSVDSPIGVNNITFYSGVVPGGEYTNVSLGAGTPKVPSNTSDYTSNTGSASSGKKKSSNIGAIVGGVVGGVVGGLLLLLALLWWCCRRRRKQREVEVKRSPASGSYFEVLGTSYSSSNSASGPVVPPKAATMRSLGSGSVASKGSFGYTAHNYGGSYEPPLAHLQPADPYAAYMSFPPTRSLRKKEGRGSDDVRSDNRSAVSDVRSNESSLGPTTGVKKRIRPDVPWGLQATRTDSASSHIDSYGRNNGESPHKAEGVKDNASVKSHASVLTASSLQSSEASIQLRQEMEREKRLGASLGGLGSSSVPLSAVDGSGDRAPWNDAGSSAPSVATNGTFNASLNASPVRPRRP